MGELQDYSGEFVPKIDLHDFSKDFLIRLMHAWSSAYLRIDEIWNQAVVKHTGDAQLALNCELDCWFNVAERTVPRIAKAANIEVKDIVDAMKVWQMCPDGTLAGVYEAEYDIKNRNHIILAVTRCRTLEFLEKNAPERIRTVCHDIDIPMNEKYLTALVPDAEMKPLLLHDKPREKPNETPCIWELKLRGM
jgi:hypothetical protein